VHEIEIKDLGLLTRYNGVDMYTTGDVEDMDKDK
jgi:hypothetical protein